jgi:hypothetical protein
MTKIIIVLIDKCIISYFSDICFITLVVNLFFDLKFFPYFYQNVEQVMIVRWLREYNFFEFV